MKGNELNCNLLALDKVFLKEKLTVTRAVHSPRRSRIFPNHSAELINCVGIAPAFFVANFDPFEPRTCLGPLVLTIDLVVALSTRRDHCSTTSSLHSWLQTMQLNLISFQWRIVKN